jgi:cytochrome o ubiquinol oxidase operon protein cyoD
MSDVSAVRPISRQASRSLLITYTSGFILSIVLTFVAYGLATHQAAMGNALIVWLLGLALMQFIVQLLFFLHIGREARPRWKLVVLLFMITVVVIVVMGSIWVMYSLNYRMSPQQINQYMQDQDGGV